MINKYFSKLITKSENECDNDWPRKRRHTRTVLSKMFNYINKELEANPESSISKIYDGIEKSIQEYLVNISQNNVRNKTIEYYLCKKAFADKSELRKKYNLVVVKLSDPSFDPLEYDFSYTFNNDSNLEKIILESILIIRDKQCDIIENNPEMVDKILSYGLISGKERIKKLRREKHSKDEDLIDFDEKVYKFLTKSEYQLVEDMLQENFEGVKLSLKEDCIKCITESVKILDKFGFIEHYTNSNNRAWKTFLIENVFSYEEVMDLLSEEKLKKLSMEKLILLSSFWSNRVNKVISSINEALHIMTQKDLIKEINYDEDGNIKYAMDEEDMRNVNLKFNVLHKISFEMFEKINMDRKEDETQRNPSEFIRRAVKKYGESYKEYFDKLFPNSTNSLEDDLWFALLYENIRYNSYKVKDKSIEALLICLFNNDSDCIENYGYREERDKKSRKHVLVAVDVKGMNMPLMLHVNKQLLLDFLQEIGMETQFPRYIGGEDFYLDDGREFNAQIFIPLSDEMQEKILKRANSLQFQPKKDRTLRHLAYLANSGKMPNHMMEGRKSKKGIKYKYVRKYIDLAETDDDKRSQDR